MSLGYRHGHAGSSLMDPTIYRKRLPDLISSSRVKTIRSETHPFESMYQEAIHQRKETDDRRDYAIRKRLTRSRQHQRTPAFGVWIERRRGRKGTTIPERGREVYF